MCARGKGAVESTAVTPEYRKSRQAHFRAYDRMYDAVRRGDRKLYDTARHFSMRKKRLQQMKDYYAINRTKILRRRSARLCADDMVAEALA